MTNQVAELLRQSLLVFEQVLDQKDVVKVVKSFPELTNALNDQQDLTKRLILEPTLPSVIGSELWRSLVSAAYIESSELNYQIRKMTVLRNILELDGVPRLVSNSPEYESFVIAIRNLASAIIQDGRCAAWIEKHLWLLIIDTTKLSVPLKKRDGEEIAHGLTDEYNRSCADQKAPENSRQNKGSGRAQVLNDLAIQYVSEGQYDVAVPLCNQALDELKKTKGNDNPEVAKMLTVLALVYRDKGNYKRSAKLLNDALTIRTRTLGEDHLDVASSLNNLGVLYSIWGKWKEAEGFFNRALKIREKVLGSGHPSVANQLSNLSFLSRNLGRYKDGVAYCERALEIYNSFLRPDNAEIAKKAFTCLNNRKYKEAGSLYKELLIAAHENRTCENENNLSCTRVTESSSIEQDFSHKVTTVDRSTVTKTLRNLASLFYCQHKYEATKTIENCLLKTKTKGSVSPSSPKVR